MAYVKTNWKDRVVERPNTYTMTDNGNGTVTLTPVPGQIIERGTPLNAENLNKIEDAIVETNTQLSAVSNRKMDKTEVLSMANMGQDIKEAMTGGSVAVVERNAVLTENIVDKQVTTNKTNFIDEESLILDYTNYKRNLSIGITLSEVTVNSGESSNFLGLLFPVEKNTIYRIKKKQDSNRFRIVYLKEDVVNRSVTLSLDRVVVNNDSLSEYEFNSLDYSFVAFAFSSNSEEIEIEVSEIKGYTLNERIKTTPIINGVKTENIADNQVTPDKVSFIKKELGGDLYDDSMKIHKLAITPDYTVITDANPGTYSLLFEVENNSIYRITKEESDRFRVGLTTYEPHHEYFIPKVVIDDATKTICTFSSETYNYCMLTYTVSDETPKISIEKINCKLESYIAIDNITNEQIEITDTDGVKVTPKINSDWSGWTEERLKFGLSPTLNPVPLQVESQLISKGTVITGGIDTTKLRWGFHVFEGYAKDNKSRITMLVNKHIEEGRPLAELYYYLTAYNHSNEAYGWFKIGSDVKQHSFMFSRDKAIAFGEWDFRNIVTLARISPSNDLDNTYDNISDADNIYEAENNATENAKCVLYLSLKNAKDGAMFYDTERNEIVVKKNGKWYDMQVTEVPAGTYNF